MHTAKSLRIISTFAIGVLFVFGLVLLLDGTSPSVRADPGVLFVAASGTGTACSQAEPCALDTALGQATDGDVIYVAQGTYTGSGDAVVSIHKSVALYGGWDGSPSGPIIRDPDAYPTPLRTYGPCRCDP